MIKNSQLPADKLCETGGTRGGLVVATELQTGSSLNFSSHGFTRETSDRAKTRHTALRSGRNDDEFLWKRPGRGCTSSDGGFRVFYLRPRMDPTDLRNSVRVSNSVGHFVTRVIDRHSLRTKGNLALDRTWARLLAQRHRLRGKL